MKLTRARVGLPKPVTGQFPRMDGRCANYGLGYERFLNEAKLAYIKLNISTACPSRAAVPVNARARFGESVSTQRTQLEFRSGMRPLQLCREIRDRLPSS